MLKVIIIKQCQCIAEKINLLFSFKKMAISQLMLNIVSIYVT